MTDEIRARILSTRERGLQPRGDYHVFACREGATIQQVTEAVRDRLRGNHLDEAVLLDDAGACYLLYDRTLPEHVRPGARIGISEKEFTVMSVDRHDSEQRTSEKESWAAVGLVGGVFVGAVGGFAGAAVLGTIGYLLGGAFNNHDRIERAYPSNRATLDPLRSMSTGTLGALRTP